MWLLSAVTAKRLLCAAAACYATLAIWGEVARGSLVGTLLAIVVFGCFACGIFISDPAASLFDKDHRWPAFFAEAVSALLASMVLYAALSDLHRSRTADFIGDTVIVFIFLAGVFWRHLEVRAMLRRVSGR